MASRIIAGLLLLGIAGMAYVRLAPVDPRRWHVDPAALVPAETGWATWVLYPPGPTDGVVEMEGGAFAAVFLANVQPDVVLARLSRIATETPRTHIFAGEPASHLMTWQTRSLIWGFPDYTTARVEWREPTATFEVGNGTMLYIVARQRFGQRDMGVNAARLRDWLSRL